MCTVGNLYDRCCMMAEPTSYLLLVFDNFFPFFIRTEYKVLAKNILY